MATLLWAACEVECMTGYVVDMNNKSGIDFAPDSTVKEVLQNLRTILGTVKGEIPLDRNFGISGDVVDLPMQEAEAKMTQEIFNAIRRYEPRVVINALSYTADINGRLIPKLEVSINAQTG